MTALTNKQWDVISTFNNKTYIDTFSDKKAALQEFLNSNNEVEYDRKRGYDYEYSIRIRYHRPVEAVDMWAGYQATQAAML